MQKLNLFLLLPLLMQAAMMLVVAFSGLELIVSVFLSTARCFTRHLSGFGCDALRFAAATTVSCIVAIAAMSM